LGLNQAVVGPEPTSGALARGSISCQSDSGVEPKRCVEMNLLKVLIDYEEREIAHA
jgi:hypothetical protein